MALDPTGLEAAITALASDPPETFAGCAEAWADAMYDYTQDVEPESTSVTDAANALEVDLEAAFQLDPDDVADALEAAFLAFAQEVISTMTDPTDPTGDVGWSDFLAADPSPETHAEAGAAVKDMIHDWFITAESDGSPIE